MSDSLLPPWTVACSRLLRPWDFLGKRTGVGCHLTSFKIILLHHTVTAVISSHIKNKLTTIGEFLRSHLNIEDGRKREHFQHMMLYYFKKGKNATETQTVWAAYGERALTD